MPNKEEFDFFVEQMHNNAAEEFKKTEEYGLLREKLDQMDRDCDTMLTADEKDFAVECFDLLLDVSGQEEHYIYRKGLLDGIKILKWLEVLV